MTCTILKIALLFALLVWGAVIAITLYELDKVTRAYVALARAIREDIAQAIRDDDAEAGQQ